MLGARHALISEQGDYLQVALDVSGDGHLPWPPQFATNNSNIETGFYNITIFLYSYEQNTNFTITNNTNATGGPPISNILYQESGSTVKHVNWLCMPPSTPSHLHS
jgi:hypothetical protein